MDHRPKEVIMNVVTTWTPLKEAGTGDLVLLIDFTETGRKEAGFPDLIARLDHVDVSFWHVVPPQVTPDSAEGPAYVRSWLDPILASGRTVRAVLGYCVGAVYAAEIVDSLAEHQDRVPELIVFDPEPTSLANVYFQFGKVFDILSSILTEEDIAATRQAMDRMLLEDGMTIERYSAELYEVFQHIAHNAFLQAGLEIEYAEEMLGVLGAFLSYLTYANQIDPWEAWSRGTAISSATPHNGLNKLRAERGGALVAQELRFDEGHAELFRSDDVVRAVTKLLER